MSVELGILHWLQNLHTPGLDTFMLHITSLGDTGWFWLALAVVLLGIKRTRRTGCYMLLAIFIGFIISNVLLKNIVMRPRPCWVDDSVAMLLPIPHDYSFPSGHSTASFAGAVAIYLNHKRMGIAAIVLAGLIAFSRLYLFVHFPTDVLVGTIIGIGSALFVNWVWRKGKLQRRQRS